jgi:predicted metal-dependent peptidase
MSNIIKKDRMRLIIKSPFFATILLKHNLIEDESIPTACINGVDIRYNPSWYHALSPVERETVLCHEALHITNLHHLRRQNRNPMMFNVACDYAINQYLMMPPFQLPKDGLFDAKYDKMSAETIYSMLQQDDQQSEDTSDGDDDDGNEGDVDAGGMGGVSDHPDMSSADIAELEAETKVMIRQAMTVAKAAGKMPKSIELMFNDLLKPVVDWRSLLSRWIEGFCNGDYSWNIPNPVHMKNRIVMPTLQSDAFANINIAIDTSGSMSDEVLQQAVSEVFAGLSVYTESNQDDVEIKVIYCDSEINKVDTIEYEGQVTKPCGRGGTLFTPVFDYIKSDPPAGLVYITDGYGWDFPDDPSSEVVWLITKCGDKSFKPPYGDVIHMS